MSHLRLPHALSIRRSDELFVTKTTTEVCLLEISFFISTHIYFSPSVILLMDERFAWSDTPDNRGRVRHISDWMKSYSHVFPNFSDLEKQLFTFFGRTSRSNSIVEDVTPRSKLNIVKFLLQIYLKISFCFFSADRQSRQAKYIFLMRTKTLPNLPTPSTTSQNTLISLLLPQVLPFLHSLSLFSLISFTIHLFIHFLFLLFMQIHKMFIFSF